MKKTSEHQAINNAIQRCYNPKNPKFPHYGGRGIKVCDRWKNSRAAFLLDMGPKPHPSLTLERIDNNGNYEPGNCRWDTRKQQSANRRACKPFEMDGKTMLLKYWMQHFNLNPMTFYRRLRRGWSVESALKTPMDNRYNRKSEYQIAQNRPQHVLKREVLEKQLVRSGYRSSLASIVFGKAEGHSRTPATETQPAGTDDGGLS